MDNLEYINCCETAIRMRFQLNETFRAQVKFAVDLSPTKSVRLWDIRESEVVTFSIHTHLSREFLKPYLEKALTHRDTHALLPYPSSHSRLPCKSPGNRKKDQPGAPCHVHGLSPKVSSVHYAPAAGASTAVKRRKKRGGELGVLLEEPRRGARSENRISLSFSFSPPPHPVGPAEFLPRSGPGTMPRPDPHPPGVRHSPPRSVPRCRRLPRRRRPPWPWWVPPLTGPEAPAAAAASLLAARPAAPHRTLRSPCS